MAPEVIASLVGVGVATCVQGAALLIWGAGLSHRVRALEDDVKPLTSLLQQVTRVETRVEGIIEQLKDLNNSIRWLRHPADDPTPTPFQFPPRGHP
jgi:hypothetical protein